MFSILKKFTINSLKNNILGQKYLITLNKKNVKIIKDLIVYKDVGFSEPNHVFLQKNMVVSPKEVVFSKAGTPRIKFNNGYITANKNYVCLTTESVTKLKVIVNGVEQLVRSDIHNYFIDLEGKNVKALIDLKVYRDLNFKILSDISINKGTVFKSEKIEFTKGGTPRFKVNGGYVSTNRKFVDLTLEPVSKTKISIDGVEVIVRNDIENYFISLDGKNVKALLDLKVYKDMNFKLIQDKIIKKDQIFSIEKIEVTKGGTPRFKIKEGYVTANKKFVTLTEDPITKKTILINDVPVVVRGDIENYYISFDGNLVKAQDELKIYSDLNFKIPTQRKISKGDIFKVLAIEFTKGGTPRFKVNGGYVTANKKYVALTKEKPLVSLVIPIYNVEKYLEQCLISLRDQTYKNIEVIQINDGSPDNSIQIAEKFCQEDSRFKLHTQANAGLSAARNTGIELATGQFIWFIDSDDIISNNAVEIMVNNLIDTGSDFAVGCYRRINSSGAKKAGPWIQEVHQENKDFLKIEDYPNILVNATAWSKVINYNFLKNNNLYFPVGVLYEDQLWSTKLYSSAQSFNVVKDTVYDWRVRDDNSSITQQSKNTDNLDAILTAIQTSLNYFKNLKLFEIANERVVQVLSNNMREYISYLNHTDRSYMEKLSDGLNAIVENFPLEKWREVPAQIAAIEWLLIHREFEKVEQYLKLDGLNTNTLVATFKNDHLILQVPFYDDSSVNFPDQVLALIDSQYEPNIQLRKAFWNNANELYLEGWAYLPLVNPTEISKPVEICLVSNEDENDIISLNVEHFIHPQLDRVSRHRVNDYRKFGYKLNIDFNKLNLKVNSNYKLRFKLSIGNIERFEYLKNVANFTSSGNIKPSTLDNSICIRLIRKADQALLINTSKKVVYIEEYKLENNINRIVLKSDINLEKIEFTHLDNKRKPIKSYYFELIDLEKSYFEAKIDMANLPTESSTHWLVRAVCSKNNSYAIDSNNFLNEPLYSGLERSEFLSFFNTDYGNWGLLLSKPKINITKMSFNSKGATLKARVIGEISGDIVATLSDHRHSIPCTVVHHSSNEMVIVIPFEFHKWERVIAIPSGRYQLTLSCNEIPLQFVYSNTVISRFPAWFKKNAPIVGNFELNPKSKNLVMIVHPAASLSQMGERLKYQYIQKHIDAKDKIDDKAILFRTYYGESTTCCSLGIHKELVNKKLGFKMYWSVKDSSVQVPEGGIPVIEYSEQWYDLYSKVKYIVDNTHQPDFFHKKEGQIVVETFHGYPFKMSGIPYWKEQGFSNRRIESFLHRHDQWDYLVSPAPYATPILKDVFPSNTAEMLEIGYPRNDIYFDKASSDIREKVRKILGVDSTKKIILYAPTYRDNLTENEFKAKMVDFLDFNKLIDEIPDDFVILIRGHAINARTNERLNVNSSKIIDVTDYPEISELCLASDLAILDYSSLRFDYALTGNPIIYYVPDLEDYVGDIRGCLVPYEETAPGPLVKTQSELVYWLNNIDHLIKNYVSDRQIFIEKYMPLEDGGASERFLNRVLLNS